MRWFFILLIAVLAASDIMGRDFGLGPGLSLKNALLYMIALGLFFRLALSGNFRMRVPVINAAFALWVGYALLSWVTCSVIVHYAGYNAIQSAIALKSILIDSALFFLTALYGADDEGDVKALWKTFGVVLCLSSFLTLTDVAGLTGLGLQVGTSGAEADRVFGVFGHANETAAVIVYLLPSVVATAMWSQGPARVMWFAGAVASLAVFILTVSRGGYVAFVVGYVWALFLCRKYINLQRIGGWVLVGLSAIIFVVILVSIAVPHVGEVVGGRLFGQSTAIDMSEVSSGRTSIWKNVLEHMIDEPLTFLTGFGWNVYNSRFLYVTHNYYLDQWFDLGLAGVGAMVLIFYQAVRTARRAAEVADPQIRSQMIASVFGVLAFAVAIFFTNPGRPWAYIWIYLGITMRAAADTLARSEAGSTTKPLTTASAGVISRAGASPRVVTHARVTR